MAKMLHVSGDGLPSTPKNPHTAQTAKQPLPPPGVELPKVLQANSSLRASQIHITQSQDWQTQQDAMEKQQSASTIQRPRTSPPRPSNPPLLTVRSLHVLPRPLHSPSLLKLPLRQRPVTASSIFRMNRGTVSDSTISPMSPLISVSDSPVIYRKGVSVLTPSPALEEIDGAACITTSPQCHGNDGNSRNKQCMADETPPKEKTFLCSTPSPTAVPLSHQKPKTSFEITPPTSNGGADEMSSNNREQPLACNSEGDVIKKPSCRRNLAAELEKELTFKPVMNQRSRKIVSRSMKQNAPLLCRLTERKKNYMNRNGYTFAPKINPHSVKLAQERADKIEEIRAKMAEHNAKTTAEANSSCTFKPQVSEKSIKIAENLGTSFEKRQAIHLEKRKKALEESQAIPTKSQVINRPKRPTGGNTSEQKGDGSTSTPPKSSPSVAITGGLPSSTDSSPTSNKGCDPKDDEAVDSFSFAQGGSGSNNPSSSCSPPRPPKTIGASTTPGKTTSPAITPTSQIKNGSRKRTSVFSNSSSSKVKCKAVTVATKKKEKAESSTSEGSSSRPPPVPYSPQQKKEQELENANFSSLRSERDRIKYIRMMAEKKIKEKKIFLVHGGYRVVRRCLRGRGWVELNYHKHRGSTRIAKGTAPKKIRSAKVKVERSKETDENRGEDDGNDDDDDDDDSDVDLDLGLPEVEYDDEEEYCLLSRAVRNNAPNFIWTLYREPELYNSITKHTVANHFAKASSFTTKVDLCANLRNVVWYGDTNPDTFFPRCYCLHTEEEKQIFIDDYRFTAAINILKSLSQRHGAGRSYSSLGSSSSTESMERLEVSGRAVRLAIRAGEAYIKSRAHDDIEGSDLHLCPKVLESEWQDIIQYFYKINAGGLVICNQDLLETANQLLKEIEKLSPQFNIDGSRNIWIVKPGSLSRGRGITCLAFLDDILNSATGSGGVMRRYAGGRFVVQKYIERPLLIHDTKFDIRQWFLVTDWNPLTMWFYRDCYLRFSSQPYTLDCLDTSIHLCNNSIQKHYTNSKTRSANLPDENMWDSDTFKEYLTSIGKDDCWDEVIYPGMKKALIYALQVTQDEIEHRKNCFELYGADFMICSNFQPWLIEINSSPTMEASTEVTARLCRQVLEDTLKVVIDRKESKDCDTGRFELAYKQARVDAPPYVGMQLCIKGSAMKIKNSGHSRIATLKQQMFSENLSKGLPLLPVEASSRPQQPYNSCRNTLRLTYRTPQVDIAAPEQCQ